MATSPKTLIYDIEVTSDIGDSWQKWNTNIHHYRRNWYMLCFAYKWLGEKQTRVIALPDFKLYKKQPENDYEVVMALWNLYNQADIVIAHNGNGFDQKKSQARMLIHNLPPPEPYTQIDTKLVAKRYFNFTSNKLDDLAGYFGIPGKLDTGGYGLWLACEAGDMKAWAKMKRYNRQDVEVLEQVYLRMRPWITGHPAINVLSSRPTSCPKCGGSKMHKGMKYRATSTNLYQYYRCADCGGMSKARIAEYKQAYERMEYV